MSQSFRPVKEIWNSHSSCFVESEELVALLHDLAVRAGTASDEHEYGDNKAVWIEDGTKVLGYMEADERFKCRQLQRQHGRARDSHQQGRAHHADRQYAEPGKTVAEFHRRRRGTGVLHRCLLSPARVIFHRQSDPCTKSCDRQPATRRVGQSKGNLHIEVPKHA
jgi:hypothetical protein